MGVLGGSIAFEQQRVIETLRAVEELEVVEMELGQSADLVHWVSAREQVEQDCHHLV